jgi:hypothetical protein
MPALRARLAARAASVRAYARPASYVENKVRLTGQTIPGRRITGHWPYPGPEELAEAEPVGPDAWTFLSLNYHPGSALALT